ncbi:MAG: hypothetical protein NWR76_03785 [Opitutales bacterium]|nr:hypothetical protein [Opitutales bacterium]
MNRQWDGGRDDRRYLWTAGDDGTYLVGTPAPRRPLFFSLGRLRAGVPTFIKQITPQSDVATAFV